MLVPDVTPYLALRLPTDLGAVNRRCGRLGGGCGKALRGSKLKEEKTEAEAVLDGGTQAQAAAPLRELRRLLAVPSTLPVGSALSRFQASSPLPGPRSPPRLHSLQDPLPLLSSQTVFFVFGIRHTQVLCFTLCEIFFLEGFFFCPHSYLPFPPSPHN